MTQLKAVAETRPDGLASRKSYPLIGMADVLSVTLAERRAVIGEVRSRVLGKPVGIGKVLTPPSGSAKFLKSTLPEYAIYLSPARMSGTNVCRWSTKQCRALCLHGSGRGAQHSVQLGRLWRTRLLLDHPEVFWAQVWAELRSAERRHGKGKFWFRPNGTSDLPFHEMVPWLFEHGPQAYAADYTKNGSKAGQYKNLRYYVAFSASERDSWHDIRRMATVLPTGVSVAVRRLPKDFERQVHDGITYVNADLSDEWLRASVDSGPIIGLLSFKTSKGNTINGVKVGEHEFVKPLPDYIGGSNG